LIPRTFRINLCLSDEQDISRIPSLHSTNILLQQVLATNFSLPTTPAYTQTIYGSSLPSFSALKNRQHVMNSIFAKAMKILKRSMAIKNNDEYSIGVNTTLSVLDVFTDLLQILNDIVTALSELSQFDFNQLDTNYYSNSSGPSAVNTAAQINQGQFGDTTVVELKVNLINDPIKIAMKSLAYHIAQAYQSDSTNLSVDKHIRNSLNQLFPFAVSIMNSMKVLCNPLLAYNNIDTFIISDLDSPSEALVNITESTFDGYGPSLLNLMAPLELTIISLYRLIKRPVLTSPPSVFEHKRYPSMHKIGDYSRTVVATLNKIDIVAAPGTFIKDLCVGLSSMIELAIVSITPTQFDVSRFITSFIDETDQSYLTTAFNLGAVISNNNLVFTQYCVANNVILLDSNWYDLINNLPSLNTTDLTTTGPNSQPLIFASAANAADALISIGLNLTISQINNLIASTQLNNNLGYRKSLAVMGGINNIQAISEIQEMVSAAANSLQLANILAAAQTNLTTAQTNFDTARAAVDQAVILANSTVLATAQALTDAQLLVEADPTNTVAIDAAHTVYHAAEAVSNAASADLALKNADLDAKRKLLLEKKSIVNALLANSQMAELAIKNAYNADILCNANRLITQNASIVAAWTPIVQAQANLAAAQGQPAIDAAQAVLNALLATLVTAATSAVAADNAQILIDVGNVAALAADNAQLALDQSVLTAANKLVADYVAPAAAPAVITTDTATLSAAVAALPLPPIPVVLLA
jgi:hypothetical protein